MNIDSIDMVADLHYPTCTWATGMKHGIRAWCLLQIEERPCRPFLKFERRLNLYQGLLGDDFVEVHMSLRDHV